MNKLVFAAAWVVLAGAPCLTPLGAQTVTHRLPRLAATFPDLAGRVFEPGEEVRLTWTLAGDVKYYENNVWAECELLLSTDGGATWSRITPQLSVTRRYFSWVVPDLPTGAAKVGLKVGIEGYGDLQQFASDTFSIADTGGGAALALAALPAGKLRAGSTLELAWSATVPDLLQFEVLISSDRGAHFFSVGMTSESHFSYRVPTDYEGLLTVQIVAHREGAAPLRSALDAHSTRFVSARDGAIR